MTEAKDDLVNALLPPRSVPNTASSSHDLSTFITDGQFKNLDTCAACTRNGYACTNVPFCSAGVRQQKRQCAQTCSSNSRGICGSEATCFSNSFCLDLKSVPALLLCQTPTQDSKSQQTKAVSGSDVTLQYARKSFRSRPP